MKRHQLKPRFLLLWAVALSAGLGGLLLWRPAPPVAELPTAFAERQGEAGGGAREWPAAEPQWRALEETAEQKRELDALLPASGRFAVAADLPRVWRVDTGGQQARVERLIERRGGSGRLARVVERFVRDADRDGWRLVSRSVMAADSVVVAVPAEGGAERLARRLEAEGFRIRPWHMRDAVLTVELPEAALETVPEALAALEARLPGVTAEPNFIYYPAQVTPEEYDPPSLWGLENIEAPFAWTVGTGSTDVVVAVIDSGVDTTHPDLAANLWVNGTETPGNGRDDDGNGFADDVHGWDFAGNTGALADNDGHGTHVSGTIGAVGDNGTGVVGVNWSVRIMALRVGDEEFENANTLNALRYVNQMRASGVNIVAVNASYGGGSSSATFRAELERARDLGILFVAAAGNDSANNDVVPSFPASYTTENVIAVASINQANRLSKFSNYGAVSVDLAAPGTGIRSTVPGGYTYYNGTSMATPHVSGAIALLAALEPGLDWRARRQRLLASVTLEPALTGRVASGGRLNLRRLVAPAMVRPIVKIVEPQARVAVLEDAALDLDLEAALLPDGEATAEADLIWEAEGGSGEAVVFDDPRGSHTRVRFSAPGAYTVRVRAVAGALADADEVSVIVGGGDLPAEGLRAWWRFDEAAGAAVDSSGHGVSGTVSGALRGTGVFGGAMVFDGVDDKVFFVPPRLERMSITAWVRADTRGNSIFPRIVHMRQGLFFLGLDDSAEGADGNSMNLKFAVDDGTEERVWFTPPGTMQTGRWYHVAVSYDHGAVHATPRLYIDGQPRIVGVQAGFPPGEAFPVNEGYIGDKGDASRAWDGPLDEIRLYDRELSAAEVAWIATEPAWRPILEGTVEVGAVSADGSVRVRFVRGPAGVAAGVVTGVAWRALADSPAWITAPDAAETEVRFVHGGRQALRLDVATDAGVVVSRRIEVQVPEAPAVEESAYAMTGDDGRGAWLFADGAGGGVYFSTRDGIGLARRVSVETDGAFSGKVGGVEVQGRIVGAAAFALEEGQPLAGGRIEAEAGAADPARDGVYDGGVLGGPERLTVIVRGGRIWALAEGRGRSVVGEGVVDEAGDFSFALGEGLLEGRVADGEVRGTRVLGGGRATVFAVREGAAPPRRLVNLSVRGRAGPGDAVLIAGFVVEGEGGSLPVLSRGVGPGLANFEVSDPLPVLRLELRQGERLLAANSGWEDEDPAGLAAAADAAGAFPLEDEVRDAAMLTMLPAGAYTATVEGIDGAEGVALAETFAVGSAVGSSTLVNLSARGRVGPREEEALIGGFVIEGEAPLLVLVRGIGPTLAGLGVDDPLPDPVLTVAGTTGALLAVSGWDDRPEALLIGEAAERAGAFPLEAGSRDAAALLYLDAGAYTVRLFSASGATGVALVEIYRVPVP